MRKLDVYISMVIVLILSVCFFLKVEKLNYIRSKSKFNFQIPVIKSIKVISPQGVDYVGVPSVWGFSSSKYGNGGIINNKKIANTMLLKEKKRSAVIYIKRQIGGIHALCKKGFKNSCILFFGLVYKEGKPYVVLFNSETKKIMLLSSDEVIVNNLTIIKISNYKIKIKYPKGIFLINLFEFPEEKDKNKTTFNKNLP